MKTLSLIIFLAAYPCLAQVAKQGNDTLSSFLGKWEGKGTSKDSAYSKAGPSSAQTNCDWSPNRGFLVCEQIVHLPDGTTQNDLSIYTYNETDHSYAFYGLSRNNSNVRTPKLTIEDKRWTYSGEFENNGKKIRFRTINDFTAPTSVTYRAEYSEDGAHWTLMSEGTNTRRPSEPRP